MAAEKESKKYYWLKLNLDFFDREEVKLIENMPNGKEYIIFYMKLLLKSANSEGRLMFREVIPYTDEMLSSITGTNIDVVRTAVNLFIQLGMMQKLDDGALFLHEVQNMIGCETDFARKKREYRERKKLEQIGHNGDLEKTSEDNSIDNFSNSEDIFLIDKDNIETKKDNVRQEKEIDIDTTTKIDILNKKEPKQQEEEKDSSSSSFSLIKNMLEQHGISNNTKANIMVLVREENITPERVGEVLKASQIKHWQEGAIYTALRDNWKIDLEAEQTEKEKQREKSVKIDEQIKKSSQEYQAMKDKFISEREEKDELLNYSVSLPVGIFEELKHIALVRAKEKYPFGFKTMLNTVVIYEVLREYRTGVLKL